MVRVCRGGHHLYGSTVCGSRKDGKAAGCSGVSGEPGHLGRLYLVHKKGYLEVYGFYGKKSGLYDPGEGGPGV